MCTPIRTPSFAPCSILLLFFLFCKYFLPLGVCIAFILSPSQHTRLLTAVLHTLVKNKKIRYPDDAFSSLLNG